MGKKIQCIGRYVMDGVTLGKGNFAKVELATHSVTGCKVAIKIMDTRKIKEDYVKINLHREARILGQLRHPNIVRLYETLKVQEVYMRFTDVRKVMFTDAKGGGEHHFSKASTLYCLVLEYAAGGDLLSFVKVQKDQHLQESKARPYFRQLTSAINFLHERGVAHRDLKMENILLDEKRKCIKVIDFGLSNTYSKREMMKTHCGSLEYAAPELISSNDKYGPEVDIWSMGIILYAMVVGKLPFTTHYTDQYRRIKLQAQIEKGLAESHQKEMVHLGLSPELKELLIQLVEPALEYRLPMCDIQTHPWLTVGHTEPFVPFQHLPKDKAAKTQEIEIDTDIDEVIDELAGMLETPKETIQKTVNEHKCDDMSAMFNMLLDTKRQEKGMFDIDFTKQQEEKKVRRRKHRKREPKANPPESENEVHEHRVQQSHNSTNFDLMALCSAPTWLGSERRKSRRRRSPMPPHSPMVPSQEGENPDASAASAAAAAPAHELGNLLSPGGPGGAAQVSELLRRTSSRRRSRRTSSADPPSRHGSVRRYRRTRPSTPGSDPHSPHSPFNLNNPEIKIDTPKHSPIPSIRRPNNLLGLKDCYREAAGLSRSSTLGPNYVYTPQSRRKMKMSLLGMSETDQTDSSNPCSMTNLQEDSDSSQEMLSRHSSQESKTSIGEPSVESKIASADIRSIVRPKRFVLRGKVNGPVRCAVKDDNLCSLLVPNLESLHNTTASVSPDIIIETSMQPNTYANSSDDDIVQNRLCSDLLQTDMDTCRNRDITEIRLPTLLSSCENINSSIELLGAAGLKPVGSTPQNYEHVDTSVIELDHGRTIANHMDDTYANNIDSIHKTDVKSCDIEETTEFLLSNECKPVTADLYSKQEKISLDSTLQMQDDISFVDSSDHNSSQEHLLSHSDSFSRTLHDYVASNENESVSAPELISPRDLTLKSHSDGCAESPDRDNVRSFMPTRHGSTPSVKFVMPSTPIRQMFKTPIARVESFHSDDFEVFTSDVDALVTPSTRSPSLTSLSTPTVPCFQYKLHSLRKKNILAKSSRNRSKCVKDGPQSRNDRLRTTMLTEKFVRLDGHPNDTLFSTSSECSDGQINECDKGSSKAKIYPMQKDEEQNDQRINKMTPQVNDKAKSIVEHSVNQANPKKNQKSVNKSSNAKPDTERNKSALKTAWRRGFAHLLKRKRCNSRTAGCNNNDADSPSRNVRSANQPSTRNGHARGTVPVSPPGGPEDPTAEEIQWSQPSAVVTNNVAANSSSGLVKNRASPAPSPSPTRTRVYDFTIVTAEPPKGKSCLLSWKSCRECTYSEEQSSGAESSDGNICASLESDPLDPPIQTTAFQEPSTFAASTTAQS